MIDGILNIYKESGYTSHDVVAKLRGILHQKKVGHTGTLDPEAQGVLPVCLGRATKVCGMLTGDQKEYRAVMRLGVTTDTQDMTGTVLMEQAVSCTEQEVRNCVESFIGKQMQLPPMYSAIRVEGKRLYELARQGIEVERERRPVEIFSIHIEEIRLPLVTMTVRCSKGTYIRTLCQDIGQALGCGGCMDSLLRTASGAFVLENSVKLAGVEEMCRAGRLSELLVPIDRVFGELPQLTLTADGERLVRNGNQIARQLCREKGEAEDGDQFRVYGTDGSFLAVYRWSSGRSAFVPVKMFL